MKNLLSILMIVPLFTWAAVEVVFGLVKDDSDLR